MIEICAGILHVSICTSMRYLNCSGSHSFVFAFAVVCRNVIVVRCFFFVIVSTLLLNSFPSFIIFRFCSLLRVDLVVAISSIHYILFSNEYSCAPKRDSQSPFFLSFFLFHFGLRLCPFVFHLLCLALFCRG